MAKNIINIIKIMYDYSIVLIFFLWVIYFALTIQLVGCIMMSLCGIYSSLMLIKYYDNYLHT